MICNRLFRRGYKEDGAAYTKQEIRDRLIEHRQYITLHGEDMPEVREWTWPY